MLPLLSSSSTTLVDMLAISASILLLAISGAQATKSLGLSMSGPEAVVDVDKFVVVATFINTGDEALKLYEDPRTALSAFPEDKFTLSTSDSTVVEFIGAHIRYTFEAATNFIELAPGGTIDVSHQLSAAYNFTAAGEYQVKVANGFNYQDASGAPVGIDADVSGNYTAKLQGNLISSTFSKRAMSLAKRTTFDSCNGSRTFKIDQVLRTTMAHLSTATEYLSGLTGSSTRYVYWWGTYSDKRKSHVRNVYNKISYSNPWSYTYYCDCDRDSYAYVYPKELGHIYLCKGFWKAAPSGTNSMAGTIIHEASHFVANGGTVDYVYGMGPSRDLAKSDPEKAIMNADTYQYFAETMGHIL